MNENELATIVVDLCLRFIGLLESVYEEVLCYELKKLGIKFSRQKVVSVVYEDVKMDVGFRADVIVAEKLMLELKSAETVTSVHQKILLTYLRMTDMKLGLLINFREELLKNGIKRIVNKL